MQAGGSFYGSPAHPAALAAAVATSHMSYTNGSFVGGQQLQVAQPGHGYGAGGGYGHGHSTSYDNSQRTVTHGSVAGNMSATGGTDLDAAIAASAQEFYVDGPGHVRYCGCGCGCVHVTVPVTVCVAVCVRATAMYRCVLRCV